MSRESLLDEAIEREKRRACFSEVTNDFDGAAEHLQMAEWLRAARGADKAGKWYTAKIRDLEDENARLRSCLSDDAENARMIMGENAELLELAVSMYYDLSHMMFPPGWAKDYAAEMRALGIEVE